MEVEELDDGVTVRELSGGMMKWYPLADARASIFFNQNG